MTVEVHDEAGDDLLAAEVEALEAIGAEMVPEDALGGCHTTSA
jgi:hypothetical protein